MPFERKTMRLKLLSTTKMLEAHSVSNSPGGCQRETQGGGVIMLR